MQYFSPILKTICLLILGYWLWYLTFFYVPSAPGFHPPLYTVVVHALNLIIHEAGHFLFKIFGRTLYVMGGSLFQVLFPLGISVFVWIRWREYAIYPLYWTGWNLIDVAVYIFDAPFLFLPLLGGGKSGHDWRYLMNHFNCMEDAIVLSLVVHWTGVFVALSALVWGVVLVVKEFREGGGSFILHETQVPADASVGEALEKYL